MAEESVNAIVVRVSPRSGIAPPLAHRWKKGDVPNPLGKRTAGQSIIEWSNQMSAWPSSAIRAVMRDKSAPHAKKIAARTLLHAGTLRTNVAGNPIAGVEFDRLCDRTDGKPVQRSEVTNTGGAYDFSRLSDDELATMRALALKARLCPPTAPGTPIEIETPNPRG